jgi:hypothetical protein
MSVSIGGKIVTDGLVVHLDALNGKSYPGSGTSWIDLTPYNNNGNLDNGNNPVTIANGYASFTDTDNDRYVDINSVGEINENTQYATVDMWIKLKPITNTSGVDFGFIFGWNTYCIQARYNNGELLYFGFTTNTNDIYGFANPTLSSLNLINNWKHYSFIMGDFTTYSVPQASQKIYINGVLQSPLSTQTGTPETTSFRNFSNDVTSNSRFPGNRFTGGQNLLTNMDVALIKIYNRELSQTEVTQNFNAHKGRFNIY